MRQSRILGVVGIAAIGFYSLVSRDNDLSEALVSTLVLSGIFLLLWQTILSLGTDVEPLDFFPGTVLLLVGLAIQQYDSEYALIPIALAMLVGLGVMMRSFGEPPRESDDEDPGHSG
ncbi:MAG: hypothetical protein VX949_09220 [Planctomycetota bacterium]|nr:hypothetical protein [Planctomycetota bacterium]